VIRWRISQSSITDFSFSPGGKYLAVVDREGFLKLLDWEQNSLVDCFKSYYGGLLCVCWSPDSAYIVCGGEDDLISIWDANKRSIVARGTAHQSWVSKIAFDPWECKKGTYRFGSVGEDCKLALWDFNLTTLLPPENQRKRGRRDSMGLQIRSHDDNLSSNTRFQATANSKTETARELCPTRGEVCRIEPLEIVDVFVDDRSYPLSDILFVEHGLMVVGWGGSVSIWTRPELAERNNLKTS